MELGEVVNPHYAFPVVGVILCVLLVFAFGFKSPAQPPSFDTLEEEKKNIPKKRSKSAKSKESNKAKVQQNQQNGRIGGSHTVKQLPEQVAQQTITNAMTLDKQNSKSEVKNKKPRSTSNASRLKSEQSEMNKSKTTNSEDTSEGEWVQQLSKKERKHRRKEEVANACVIIETDKSSDNGTWDEHQAIAELSSGSQVSTPLKGSPKQDLKNKSNGIQQTNQDVEAQKNFKKKPKKEMTVNESEISNLPAKYEELLKDNKEIETEQYNEIPKTSIEIYNETTEENAGAEEKTKKRKGKKKTQDANFSSGKSTPNEDFTSKKPVSLEDTIENKRNSFKTMKNNVANTLAAENPTITKDSQSSKPKLEDENGSVAVTEGGSNVVFDELGDLWQDARSQKKKKKARRDQ